MECLQTRDQDGVGETVEKVNMVRHNQINIEIWPRKFSKSIIIQITE